MKIYDGNTYSNGKELRKVDCIFKDEKDRLSVEWVEPGKPVRCKHCGKVFPKKTGVCSVNTFEKWDKVRVQRWSHSS